MLDQGYLFNPILTAALWNWFVAAPVKHATSEGDAKYTHDIDKLLTLVHGCGVCFKRRPKRLFHNKRAERANDYKIVPKKL